MLGKILIFGLIAVVALAVFGRGARRGEVGDARSAKSADPVDAAKRKVREARAQDLSPCPRCGAYVSDPARCDCRDKGDPAESDMQQ